jgi:hypothetical protein
VVHLLGILAVAKNQFPIKVNYMGKVFMLKHEAKQNKISLIDTPKKRGVLPSCNLSTHFTITA